MTPVGSTAPEPWLVDLDPSEPAGELDWGNLPHHIQQLSAPKACRVSGPVAEPEPQGCSTPELASERLLSVIGSDAPAFDDEAGDRCSSDWSSDLNASSFRRRWFARSVNRKLRLDRELAKLESCAGIEPGLVRVARAALYPECAAVHARFALTASTVPPPQRIALLGFAIMGQLGQIDFSLPPWKATMSSAEVERYVASRLRPWALAQAKLLSDWAHAIGSLPANTYGRALAEIALSRRWADLRDMLRQPRFEALEQRRQMAELTRSLHLEFNEQALPSHVAAARSSAMASEWQWVAPWSTQMHGQGLYAAQELILPPAPLPFPAKDKERVLALLPSYVAVRIWPEARLRGASLRALLTAGFDPMLRRALTGNSSLTLDERELAARARLVLALRTFDMNHARAAEQLLGAASAASKNEPRTSTLIALAHTLATAPSGFDAWRSTTDLSNVEPLLQLARGTTVPAALATAAIWDATLLSGSRAGQLKLGERVLVSEAEGRISSLGGCRSGFLSERPCTCPMVRYTN